MTQHLLFFFSALYHQIYCGWTGIQGRGSTYTSTSSAYSLNIRRMGLIICKIELYVLYHIIGKNVGVCITCCNTHIVYVVQKICSQIHENKTRWYLSLYAFHSYILNFQNLGELKIFLFYFGNLFSILGHWFQKISFYFICLTPR